MARSAIRTVSNVLFVNKNVLPWKYCLNIYCTAKPFRNIFRQLRMEASVANDFPSISKPTGENLANANVNKTKRKRQKRKQKQKDKNVENSEKLRKQSPNYFLAVQIDNPGIKGGLKAVQDYIVPQEKRLRPSIVDVVTAHLTLFLLHLPDDKAVNDASDLLQNCKRDIVGMLEPMKTLELGVDSLGTFRDEVLFAKIKPGEACDKLAEIAQYLRLKFDCHKASNKFAYKPHLTLMKLSKIRQQKNKIRKINKDYYKGINNVHFGVEKVRSIQLLSMLKKKQQDGYYHCDSEMFFDETTENIKKLKEIEEFSEFVANYSTVSAYCQMLSDMSSRNDYDNATRSDTCDLLGDSRKKADLLSDKVDVNSNILSKDVSTNQ